MQGNNDDTVVMGARYYPTNRSVSAWMKYLPTIGCSSPAEQLTPPSPCGLCTRTKFCEKALGKLSMGTLGSDPSPGAPRFEEVAELVGAFEGGIAESDEGVWCATIPVAVMSSDGV